MVVVLVDGIFEVAQIVCFFGVFFLFMIVVWSIKEETEIN